LKDDILACAELEINYRVVVSVFFFRKILQIGEKKKKGAGESNKGIFKI